LTSALAGPAPAIFGKFYEIPILDFVDFSKTAVRDLPEPRPTSGTSLLVVATEIKQKSSNPVIHDRH